ncbi:hypothetical protein LMH73_027020, partial [Vibrio splendidus]
MTKRIIELDSSSLTCEYPPLANVWVQWGATIRIPPPKEWNKVNLGCVRVPTSKDINDAIMLMIECYELEELVHENKLYFFIATGDPSLPGDIQMFRY